MKLDDELIADAERASNEVLVKMKKKGISPDKWIGVEYEMSDDDKEYYKQFFSRYLNFYKFNSVTDKNVVNILNKLSETGDLLKYKIYHPLNDREDIFEIKIKYDKPLGLILKEVDHKVDEIKAILCIVLMFSKCHYNIDYIKNESRDRTFNTTFKLWDRYIRVRELVGEDINVVTNSKLDKISEIVQHEFGLFKGTEHSKTLKRRDIKKDYSEAMKLIKSAEDGSFPG